MSAYVDSDQNNAKRQRTVLASGSSIVNNDVNSDRNDASQTATKIILLIIDPQIDFHPGGSLAVAGANEDSERIAAFIASNRQKISEIYVTLDSHHKMHIAHGRYWTNLQGSSPPPFTTITHANVVEGVWTPRNPINLEHAKFYTKKLEELGRFTLIIWPEHCLIGTVGHAVHAGLNDALQDWAGENLKTVHYVNKGSCCDTEMYSAIAADVPVPWDPSTSTNVSFLNELKTADKLIICGQALSHCVNFTTRDIIADWGPDKRRIVVMEDGCSPVGGFEAGAAGFLEDMRRQGLVVAKATDILK